MEAKFTALFIFVFSLFAVAPEWAMETIVYSPVGSGSRAQFKVNSNY